MLGTYTEKAESRGRSRRAFDGHGPTNSTNVSDQRRPLMLPQELRELSQTKQIVLTNGGKPILCDKIVYYTDAALSTRLLPPLEVPVVDLDAHLARIEGRKRPVAAAEIVTGVDLSRLAHNVDTLPALTEEASAEEVSAFVDEFFQALDVNRSPASFVTNTVEEAAEEEVSGNDGGSELQMVDVALLER